MESKDTFFFSRSDWQRPSVLNTSAWIQICIWIYADMWVTCQFNGDCAIALITSCEGLRTSVKIPKMHAVTRRGGKRMSGCSGFKQNMMKAEHLPRKDLFLELCYYKKTRGSSWETLISSAYRKETSTHPENPLVELNDFLFIQKHKRMGMATVIHRGLQNSFHSRPKPMVQQLLGTSWYSSTKRGIKVQSLSRQG